MEQNMDFSKALQNLKEGKPVSRTKWQISNGGYARIDNNWETFSFVVAGKSFNYIPDPEDILATDWLVVKMKKDVTEGGEEQFSLLEG